MSIPIYTFGVGPQGTGTGEGIIPQEIEIELSDGSESLVIELSDNTAELEIEIECG